MINAILRLFGKGTDYEKLISEGAVIVDVRTPGEYSSGHVKNSINVPLDKINGKIEMLKKKNKPVVACCASGMRSGSATAILKRNGIEAYNGGSWTSVRRYVK